MDDCALEPHDQVTSTKTGVTGVVLWTARESFTSGYPAAARQTGLTVTWSGLRVSIRRKGPET